ncbi:hypothetical protein NDU88_002568 [Pleurodeles waltl]|uniref:Uncharacterized protein n=1 Tax=Pleurodeles waltl TaxID=8319 RepID=A0AAV7T2B0_PLEWA|nr:hypothetical protein NDU88_002568 [Pleurodeles waltl]
MDPQQAKDQPTTLRGFNSHWSKRTHRQPHSSRGKCPTAATPAVVFSSAREVIQLPPQLSPSAKNKEEKKSSVASNRATMGSTSRKRYCHPRAQTKKPPPRPDPTGDKRLHHPLLAQQGPPWPDPASDNGLQAPPAGAHHLKFQSESTPHKAIKGGPPAAQGVPPACNAQGPRHRKGSTARWPPPATSKSDLHHRWSATSKAGRPLTRAAQLQAAARREATVLRQVQPGPTASRGAPARQVRQRPPKQHRLSPRCSGGAGEPLLCPHSSPRQLVRVERAAPQARRRRGLRHSAGSQGNETANSRTGESPVQSQRPPAGGGHLQRR